MLDVHFHGQPFICKMFGYHCFKYAQNRFSCDYFSEIYTDMPHRLQPKPTNVFTSKFIQFDGIAVTFSSQLIEKLRRYKTAYLVHSYREITWNVCFHRWRKKRRQKPIDSKCDAYLFSLVWLGLGHIISIWKPFTEPISRAPITTGLNESGIKSFWFSIRID